MASWMIHFRIADALLQTDLLRELPPEAQAAFITGNVAPDSGTPLPGGGYAPDKDTSHFMRRFDGVPAGQNPDRCDPFLLLDGWLLPALEDNDPVAAAFFLGYLCHLVTDNAWVRDFVYPAKVRLAHLRSVNGKETPEGIARFYAVLKKEWYDTDILYLRSHPSLPAYHAFLREPPMDNRFLPFFPPDAFARKREEIEVFYSRGITEAEERELCGSEAEAERFIPRVAEELTTDFRDIFTAVSALYAPIEC
jgi:hypothetical protein